LFEGGLVGAAPGTPPGSHPRPDLQQVLEAPRGSPVRQTGDLQYAMGVGGKSRRYRRDEVGRVIRVTTPELPPAVGGGGGSPGSPAPRLGVRELRAQNRLRRRKACIRHKTLPSLEELAEESEDEDEDAEEWDGSSDEFGERVGGGAAHLPVLRVYSVPPEVSAQSSLMYGEPEPEPEPELMQLAPLSAVDLYRPASGTTPEARSSAPVTPISPPARLNDDVQQMMSPLVARYDDDQPSSVEREPMADLSQLSDYDLGLLHDHDQASDGAASAAAERQGSRYRKPAVESTALYPTASKAKR
jgi:hypothetical protein